MKFKWILFALFLGLNACGSKDETWETKSADGSRITEGYLQSDGIKIYYKVVGEGRPIILVHGWGANTEMNWVNTGWVDALKPFRKVISLDVRGHGKSEKPHDQNIYGYEAMSHDVLALMDHLGIEKADYIGYSMGSFMGASLLGKHSDRFTSMILGGIGDETQESSDLSYYIAAALRAGKLVTDFFHVTDLNFDLESLALSCLKMWPEGYPRKLGGPGLMETKVPVLVINGSEDKPYVYTDQDFANMIPNAQLQTISGTNHLNTFTDKRFLEAALNFIAQQN